MSGSDVSDIKREIKKLRKTLTTIQEALQRIEKTNQEVLTLYNSILQEVINEEDAEDEAYENT